MRGMLLIKPTAGVKAVRLETPSKGIPSSHSDASFQFGAGEGGNRKWREGLPFWNAGESRYLHCNRSQHFVPGLTCVTFGKAGSILSPESINEIKEWVQ